MSRLWVFNLDAEDELRSVRCGTKTPPPSSDVARARSAAVDALSRPTAEGGLLGLGDRVRGDAPLDGIDGSLEAVAWCPTPGVCAAFVEAGWTPPPAPAVGALIEANARESFADLDPLPGALVAETEDELRAALARRPPARAPGVDRPAAWLVRESLCASGRGRVLCEPKDGRAVELAVGRLAGGSAHVLPFVDIAEEFALHGRIPRGDGPPSFGRPVLHRASGGAWRGAEPAPEDALSDEEAEHLRRIAGAVADRLAAVGYFGPFGVDAFRWTDGDGRARFHAATDVNARYTMSFGIGAPELI